MDLQLTQKRVLITGSSRGLGYATACCLLQEGARVAINSRQGEGLDHALQILSAQYPGQVIGLPGDVSEPAAPAALVAQMVAAWGGIDHLVTNAGGPPAGPFEAFDDDAWQKAIESTFLSHVRLIRAALPYLRQGQAPSVLTCTSYTVKQPQPNMVLSNSIRSATIGLTKTLALELGKEGIRFNSILPAWIDTDRTIDLDSKKAQIDHLSLSEERQKLAVQTAIGRIGTPEEFAKAAVFLLSPAASYITGVMLTVDGGLYKGTF